MLWVKVLILRDRWWWKRMPDTGAALENYCAVITTFKAAHLNRLGFWCINTAVVHHTRIKCVLNQCILVCIIMKLFCNNLTEFWRATLFVPKVWLLSTIAVMRWCLSIEIQMSYRQHSLQVWIGNTDESNQSDSTALGGFCAVLNALAFLQASLTCVLGVRIGMQHCLCNFEAYCQWCRG